MELRTFINKIATWVANDGLEHFVCSALAVITFSVVFPLSVSIFFTALLGVAKELVWDLYLDRGCSSWHDIICDAAGILFGCVLLWLL